MKISELEIEFADDCPKDCRFFGTPIDMGSVCFRCPIFNCKKWPALHNSKYADADGTICMCPPEGYRADWALAWRKWFDDGMVGLPELYLNYEVGG